MRKLDPAKHDHKRGEILDAAARCFARDGFHGASVAAICTEAGMSPGHLYHYFENKEAIIGAMAQRRLSAMAERFGKLEGESEATQTLLLGIIDQGRRNDAPQGQPLLLEMLAEAVRNPAMARILHIYSGEVRQVIAAFLRREQAYGRIDPGLDPETTAAVLMCVLDGSMTLGARNPNIDPKRARAILETLIGRFLMPPAVKPHEHK